MLLQMMTWAEIEAHRETSTGVMMPIGSTEPPEPNSTMPIGLIGTPAPLTEASEEVTVSSTRSEGNQRRITGQHQNPYCSM